MLDRRIRVDAQQLLGATNLESFSFQSLPRATGEPPKFFQAKNQCLYRNLIQVRQRADVSQRDPSLIAAMHLGETAIQSTRRHEEVLCEAICETLSRRNSFFFAQESDLGLIAASEEMPALMSERPMTPIPWMTRIYSDTAPQHFVVGKQSSDLRFHRKIENPESNVVFKSFTQIAQRPVANTQPIPFSRRNFLRDLLCRCTRNVIRRGVGPDKWHIAKSFQFKIILSQPL